MILLLRLLLLFARFIMHLATQDEREQPTQYFDNPLPEVEPITPISPNNQNYEAMIAKSSELIEKYPDDADAYSDRGGAHFLLRQFDEAMFDLNKAIELKPYYADAHNNRGVLYCAQGSYEQALQDFEASINQAPTEMAYYLNRGTCYRMIGDHLHAGADFDRAFENSWSIINIADKINRAKKILPKSSIYTKNEARILFFKANVVLMKYMGRNYPDVIASIH